MKSGHLSGVSPSGAVVTGISDIIVVLVSLCGVGHARTVVLIVDDPVVINVGITRVTIAISIHILLL